MDEDPDCKGHTEMLVGISAGQYGHFPASLGQLLGPAGWQAFGGYYNRILSPFTIGWIDD